MRLAFYAGYLGQALLVVTAVHAAVAAWRLRDSQRLDILALLAALFVIYWTNTPRSPIQPLAIALLAALPLLFLRLVQHFAVIGHAATAFAIVAVPVLTGGWMVWGRPWLDVLTGYAAMLIGACAIPFAREAARSSGVTQRRLVGASVGSALFSAAFALAAGSRVPEVALLAGTVSPFLTAGALFCFFFAFSTPRRLSARWQREEQARYLTRVAAREPEPRGAHAADDLNAAAAAGVSNAVTFVAMRPPGRPGRLAVRAATDASLVGMVLPSADDLIERVVRAEVAESGSVSACHPELAGRLAQFGSRVLMAPIAAGELVFGLVGAVQRRGSLFPDDDLELLQAFGRHAGTALDHARLMTEAKDRAQRSARRKLVEVEYRMALMLDSIQDYAIMTLDDAGTVVTWHAGAGHVFGYGPAEMTDAPAAPLFAMPSEELVRLLAEARELGLARREGHCRRRDDSTFMGTTVIRPLKADEEGVHGFVVVTRDVTERRDLEARLRQSQKMEAIGQLAGGVAHDFNNLLTAILGYAEWLARDIDPADARRVHVDEIQKAAERAAGLTRQLLTFSRGQMLRPEVLNLTAIVNDLLPMLRRMIGENIEVTGQTAESLPPILADRIQIQQVVLNLVVNARDAMPDGGRLSISTESLSVSDGDAGEGLVAGPHVVLTVEDTGAGIDAETLPHIFEPFFTTKGPRSGTGLGLSVVYGIVRHMSGVVRVKSAPGEGTVFRVYLPETLARAEATVAEAATELSGTATILLVEDDAAVRGYIRRVLERHGHVVMAASGQAEAISAVQAHQGAVDLILTDVMMPRGSGPELVKALASALPGVPALFISGYAEVIMEREEAASEVSHFLQKPFSANELLARIQQLIQPKRQGSG